MVTIIQDFWANLQNGVFPPLGVWNYFLFAALVAVEGPIATLLGAAAAGAGYMQADWVFVAASAGNLLADTFWYLLGYAGHSEWIVRYGGWLGVRPGHLERMEQGVREHTVKLLLAAKLTAGLMIPSLIAAGLARVPWRRWFLPIFVGEMIWTGVLFLIGFQGIQALSRVERWLQIVALGGIILVFLFILRFMRRFFREEEMGPATPELAHTVQNSKSMS